jgi:hypothetical protein
MNFCLLAVAGCVLPSDGGGTGLVTLLVVLWILRQKHALYGLTIIANTIFTLVLIVHRGGLIAVRFGAASEPIVPLMIDAALISSFEYPNLFNLVMDDRSAGSSGDTARR